MEPQREQKTTTVRETDGLGDNKRRTVTTTTDGAGSRPDAAPGSVLAQRVIYYVGGALIVLLALRFVLALLGANRDNPFAAFVFDLSNVFVSPFFGLFSYEPTYGVSTFEPSTVVAIIVYAILTVGIAKLFTLNRH